MQGPQSSNIPQPQQLQPQPGQPTPQRFQPPPGSIQQPFYQQPYNVMQKQYQQQSLALQQEQMKKKFGYQPSLTETCTKHPNNLVIFEQPSTEAETQEPTALDKYCEKCYLELEQKSKVSATNQSQPTSNNQQQDQSLASNKPREEQKQSQQPQISKQQQVQLLQGKLQSLLNVLSQKIQRKADHLILSHEQLSVYEKTLGEKYNPVFAKMKEITQEKQLDYMTFLLKQLNQNRDRVQMEKVTLDKLMNSFYSVGDQFTPILESQLKLIEQKDKESEKLVKQEQQEQQQQQVEESNEKENDDKQKVDTYQIEAISTILDDYDNIVSKNYCVYTNYEDFSFAETRNKEQLNEHFKRFVKSNFSGDFQIQSWFNQQVLPRVYYLQSKTKFVYTYKIMHFNSECQLIQNTFAFPDKGRHIVTAEGHLYYTGGYYSLLNLFSKNTFILDEHRYILVPLQSMKQARADHATLFFKGSTYVFGGMGFKQSSQNNEVESYKTCEVYNVKEDKWSDLPSFEYARQAFSVCTFNDKYIFIFGGKVLKDGATINHQPYEFVNQVEIYDIDRSNWRVINYISDKNKLRLIHAGAIQITGKKILIFGGIAPVNVDDDQLDENGQKLNESGQRVQVLNQTLELNVSNGELKRAGSHDLPKASYYVSGGSVFAQQGQIYALGFGYGKDSQISGFGALGGEQQHDQEQAAHELNPNSDKKVLHTYKVAEQEWSEIHEGLFAGQRKRSLEDNLDEGF